MKILLAIWIFLNCFIFAQSDCKDFKIILKAVDKNYTELSQGPFPNYVKYTLSKKDSIKIGIYNVKGDLVYQENFGLLDSNTYSIKFINPNCPGVYFVSTEIGNKPTYKKLIQITSEEYQLKEIENNLERATSILEGEWKRSYTEVFTPQLQPQMQGYVLRYYYKYDLTISFSVNDYKILSMRTEEDTGSKETNNYQGKYLISGDTLKLFEGSKLSKVFKYEIENDTLSIKHFATIDKRTGITAIPMDINLFNPNVKLVGKYSR